MIAEAAYANGGALTAGTAWVSFPEETYLLTDEDMRRVSEVLPDDLAFSDLPSELRNLDPDSLIEFFREAN